MKKYRIINKIIIKSNIIHIYMKIDNPIIERVNFWYDLSFIIVISFNICVTGVTMHYFYIIRL